jgi:putative acetyltransferase
LSGHVSISIREERPEDIDAIRVVHEQAFRRPDESRLVDALRAGGGVLLSLVGLMDDRVAGHILYSPVTVMTAKGVVAGAGLGPVGVLPECQLEGIGGLLVSNGIERLCARHCPFVTVLGHPGYYTRFGFRPASGHGITCEWAVPDDVFMVLVLDQSAMRGVSGLAKYRPEFSGNGQTSDS